MKPTIYAVMLAVMLSLTGCTVGEALLGAGAAGLGGYIIGRDGTRDTRHYRECRHYGNHTTCWD